MKPTVSKMKEAATMITMPRNSLLLRKPGILPTKSAQREIRIALVLLDDLDDVHNQADLKQNDDRLRPNVRLKRVGVSRDTRGNRGFQHMGEEREAKEDEEQNVDNQFKTQCRNSFVIEKEGKRFPLFPC